MNEIILNSEPTSKRVRLSREELLAGKCFPDENSSYSLDPRLRSPDDILSQRARAQPPPADSAAQKSIASLEQRYEKEIKAWREYEIKVLEWKKEVTEILEKFKDAANEKEALLNELQTTREKIRQQEQELAWFRQQLTVPTQTTF